MAARPLPTLASYFQPATPSIAMRRTVFSRAAMATSLSFWIRTAVSSISSSITTAARREHQGVAMARMPFENRADPVGFVSKYYVGAWTEPGIGGLVTPIFPVAVSWERSDTNALWGPAIHWNTYLNCYVVVLNHACCKPEWPQEGIYLSITPDLSDPGLWSTPHQNHGCQEYRFFARLLSADCRHQSRRDRLLGRQVRAALYQGHFQMGDRVFRGR